MRNTEGKALLDLPIWATYIKQHPNSHMLQRNELVKAPVLLYSAAYIFE